MHTIHDFTRISTHTRARATRFVYEKCVLLRFYFAERRARDRRRNDNCKNVIVGRVLQVEEYTTGIRVYTILLKIREMRMSE